MQPGSAVSSYRLIEEESQRQSASDENGLVTMAYDEELAGRIRVLVANEPGCTEKKMFGGLRKSLPSRLPRAMSSVSLTTDDARRSTAYSGGYRRPRGQLSPR